MNRTVKFCAFNLIKVKASQIRQQTAPPSLYLVCCLLDHFRDFFGLGVHCGGLESVFS